MEKNRVYFVIDMKSFFASVECAERGLDAMTTRLVVADESRTDKTICLAVSPALKALGVKNRCRLFEIPKNIDYIIAKPQMKKYIEYAAEIYGIYLKYIDKSDIHVYSIDESFIDATDYLKIMNMRAKEFVKTLMDEINEKLHIPSSAGIGTNLYLAKIALDLTAKKSPDKIGWLTEEKFIKELWNHRPITDFWQISTGTEERLKKFGVTDMQGIAETDENLLYKEFGKNAEILIDHAWGRESCLMQDIKNYKRKSHSISSSQILPCNYEFKDAKVVLKEMIEEGCYRLVKENATTDLIHIYIGYGDLRGDGEKGTVHIGSQTNLYSKIVVKAEEFFDNNVDRFRPIRRIGYDFAELYSGSVVSFDFFTDFKRDEKEAELTKSVMGIKEKYGKNAILRGRDYGEKATARERNKMIGGHNGEIEDAEN